MFSKNISWLGACMLGLAFLTACQKSEEIQAPPSPPTSGGSTGTSAADKIKDSTLLYSQDIYLWYKQIPTTFDARSYAGPGEIMTALRAYSQETGFDKPVDRWSFAIKQTEWDNVSSGIAGDFGLNVFFRQEGDLRVRTVEPASPAGLAGVRRGWRIVGLNGNTNITTANANAIVTSVYQSASTAFTFEKPDGTRSNLSLNAATYKEQPVLLDSVYTVAGKKIGYLVFNSFLGDTTQIYNRFSNVFSKFSTEQVNDVVIDLRYNGGGYVSVQDKLANYLAPASANGDILMQQQYNDKYSRYNSTTRIRKLGTLNLTRVFFIVSNNTASAGELIINNLKPYMDVKLIGPSDTYGKPVGYFPIPVGDWYIFPVSFRSTNKLGSGNYFNGLTADSKVADGLDKDWGNLEESALARAVRYITTGSFGPRIQGRNQDVFTELSPVVENANTRFGQNEFKGMIVTGVKR